jgi:hypothetical protein
LFQSFHLSKHLELLLINDLFGIFVESISHLQLIFSVTHSSFLFFTVNSHLNLVNVCFGDIKTLGDLLDALLAHFAGLSLVFNTISNDFTRLGTFVLSEGTLLVHELSLGGLSLDFFFLVFTHFRSLRSILLLFVLFLITCFLD